MVRCGTLKEAELIPDSAVPYTLPESRWNSSNRQTSNEWKRRSSHTLRHVWGNGALIPPKEKVLERANHSWLVREKDLAAQLLKRVCVLESVCVWSVFLFQATGREGIKKPWMQRTQPAGWRLNGDRAIPQGGGECEITRKVRRDMPLMFYTLCMPVFMFRCIYL